MTYPKRQLTEKEIDQITEVAELIFQEHRPNVDSLSRVVTEMESVMYACGAAFHGHPLYKQTIRVPGELRTLEDGLSAAENAVREAKMWVRSAEHAEEHDALIALYLLGKREGFKAGVRWLSETASDPNGGAMALVRALHMLTDDAKIDGLVKAVAVTENPGLRDWPYLKEDGEDEHCVIDTESSGVDTHGEVYLFGRRVIYLPGEHPMTLPVTCDDPRVTYDEREDCLKIVFDEDYLNDPQVFHDQDPHETHLSAVRELQTRRLLGFAIEGFKELSKPGVCMNVENRMKALVEEAAKAEAAAGLQPPEGE